MPNDPQYNWVYKELVKSSEDVSGALAYVLYKNAKIAYIENFLDEKGRAPSDAELAEFHRVTNLPDTLNGYRERADSLLQSFLDNVLAEQLAAFREELRSDAVIDAVKTNIDAVKTNIDSVKTNIDAVKTSFWNGVRQNIVAGLATTFFTFGFVLAAWMFSEGPMKILIGAANKMFGSEIQESTSQGTPQPTVPKK
jgi:hypothetical protein